MQHCIYIHTIKITFSRMTITRPEMKRRSNCLMNQLVHSTHCCRPIINIDSLIRVSFSNTSSWRTKCTCRDYSEVHTCMRTAHVYMYVSHFNFASLLVAVVRSFAQILCVGHGLCAARLKVWYMYQLIHSKRWL